MDREAAENHEARIFWNDLQEKGRLFLAKRAGLYHNLEGPFSSYSLAEQRRLIDAIFWRIDKVPMVRKMDSNKHHPGTHDGQEMPKSNAAWWNRIPSELVVKKMNVPSRVNFLIGIGLGLFCSIIGLELLMYSGAAFFAVAPSVVTGGTNNYKTMPLSDMWHLTTQAKLLLPSIGWAIMETLENVVIVIVGVLGLSLLARSRSKKLHAFAIDRAIFLSKYLKWCVQ